MRFERIAAAVVTPLGPYIRRVAKVYSREKVALVQALHAEGLNHSQIARRVGISRTTVRTWLSGGTPNFDKPKATCQVCGGKPATLPQAPYTYLLGLYLGDGCLAASPRDVYKLRIFCANAYPELIRRCEQAITQVLPVKVNKIAKIGCWEVYSLDVPVPAAWARCQAQAED
jgi:transcriptional regulator with XRE-family HTH domain